MLGTAHATLAPLAAWTDSGKPAKPSPTGRRGDAAAGNDVVHCVVFSAAVAVFGSVFELHRGRDRLYPCPRADCSLCKYQAGSANGPVVAGFARVGSCPLRDANQPLLEAVVLDQVATAS